LSREAKPGSQQASHDDAHMDPEFSPNHWNKNSTRFGENYGPKRNQKLAKEDKQLDFVWYNVFFFPCLCLSLKSNWGKRYK